MRDEDYLAMATARILMAEPPKDQIQLPPVIAGERQAAMMWHPNDRVADFDERISVEPHGDKDAQALFALWLGGNSLYAMLGDAKPEAKEEPRRPEKKKEDDED